MAPEDEEHTAFITDRGLYCYQVMPFGLKNAGATYQRLVNKAFRGQIGRNMEVYVDDMLTKSRRPETHVTDLQETFGTLRKYQMKLNPAKCVFGISSGKFLGFLIHQRGIEANPDKIKAILETEPPRSPRDVQRLTGRVAALSRFLSRSADRCLPFFKNLKCAKNFSWTPQSQQALEELKVYLVSPPLLTAPKEGEILYLYLSATDEALGAVLIREEEGSQRPVYYVSHILKGAELRYAPIEKLTYSLILAARKLRPYFQAHTVTVMTNHPMRQVLTKPDMSGRLLRWAVALGEFDIRYQPRTAIKAQALADFVTELATTEPPKDGRASPRLEDEAPQIQPPLNQLWTLYVDGSVTRSHGGAGLIFIGPDGQQLEYALRFEFKTTNNEAEYEALVAGLRMAAEISVRFLAVRSDSQLMVNQVNGKYEAREPTLLLYLGKVKQLASSLQYFAISHIPRAENTQADALSKLASSPNAGHGSRVLVETVPTRSIEEAATLSLEAEPSWMDELVRYQETGELPEGKDEAKRVRRWAPWYTMIDGELYRRSFTRPYLRCLRPSAADLALRELHEGICGSHAGARTLAHKLLRQGYYWPTMKSDAEELVRKCPRCQIYARINRQPATELTPIPAPWPFSQWGMDLLGPFPPASAQRKFLLVAVDYFSKWIEAEPLATTTEKQVEAFIWKNLISRYGLPRAIITDNGPQFNSSKLKEFCARYGIHLQFASVAHPQSNGLAEAANKSILGGLKKRVAGAKGTWVDELPSILWACRTTPRAATGETPFQLVYGAEAVLPVEVTTPSLRTLQYDEGKNGEILRADLDLLEEVRLKARLRTINAQQAMARYYNKRVRPRPLHVGDLVLRRTEVSAPTEARGKLAPNWEGPYRITEEAYPGTYRLQNMDGLAIPRTWNVQHLRRYYP